MARAPLWPDSPPRACRCPTVSSSRPLAYKRFLADMTWSPPSARPSNRWVPASLPGWRPPGARSASASITNACPDCRRRDSRGGSRAQLICCAGQLADAVGWSAVPCVCPPQLSRKSQGGTTLSKLGDLKDSSRIGNFFRVGTLNQTECDTRAVHAPLASRANSASVPLNRTSTVWVSRIAVSLRSASLNQNVP